MRNLGADLVTYVATPGEVQVTIRYRAPTNPVMSATDIIRIMLAPVREFAILAPLLMFWTLIGFSILGGPFGIFLLVLTMPALFRYLSFIVESYANGRPPTAFDAEFFNWVGTSWTMFPLLLAVLFGIAGYYATAAWGNAGAWLVIVVAACIVPPSLAVLAITHSAMQALNPLALLSVYNRAGTVFLIAPLYVLALVAVTIELGGLPLWARLVTMLFAMFSVAALTGALIAPTQLVREIDIPDPVHRDGKETAGDLEQARTAVLNHAYGFISRNNRDGGFRHLFAEIARDPNPAAAWDWYFQRMLGWERRSHALFFAQHYVHDALRHGEEPRALKATLRCLHEDPQFRPFGEDQAALLAAAERAGNAELVEVLKRL